ncbi:MAG: RluA family pseudouridine synthase [Bacteroidales bacterium]
MIEQEDFYDEELTENDDVLSENQNFETEGDGMFEHFRFVADKGQSMLRVDKYITNHMEKTSRHRVQLAIDAGYVRVNEKEVKANYRVKPNDIITIVMPYARRGMEILPENIPLDIAYEDEDLLVVNKPAGLVVHPGHGHFSGTLINALAFHLGMRQDPNGKDERMGILVHRIDKNTSGLLVVAKNDEAQLQLAKQFFDHSIERKYIAIVWGNVVENSGTITGNIGRDPNDRMRFKVFPNGETGKHAVTHYRVLERLGYVTLVECQLETGRTHQIRVHMTHIGHPLFNDDRYGGDRILKGTLYTKYKQFIDNCFELLPRHALHAKTLGFVHPRTGKHIFLENQLPADMVALIEKWRKYGMNQVLEEE